MLLLTTREADTSLDRTHALFKQHSILCCKLCIKHAGCGSGMDFATHIQQHMPHLLLPADVLLPILQVGLHLPAQQRQLLLQPEHLVVCLTQLQQSGYAIHAQRVSLVTCSGTTEVHKSMTDHTATTEQEDEPGVNCIQSAMQVM
jgi:hypothetical protein